MRCLVDHPNHPWVTEWYYRDCKPLLDPRLILMEGDEGYIITCRAPDGKEITKTWCKKYAPGLRLIQLKPKFKTGAATIIDWCLDSAKQKAAVINKFRLDVYFDDVPNIVRHLRRFCTSTKIIHYGHQIYEGLDEDK